jgi:hypothetical protein
MFAKEGQDFSDCCLAIAAHEVVLDLIDLLDQITMAKISFSR